MRAVDFQEMADGARGLANAVLIFDQRKADEAFTHGSESDARRYYDKSLLQ